MTSDEAWWSISDTDLRAALQRVADGENPGLVYTELYANSRIERVEGDDSPTCWACGGGPLVVDHIVETCTNCRATQIERKPGDGSA